MKTDVHLWLYIAEFFLEWEMFQTKVVEKIKTHILCSITFFFRKSCRLWYNVEKYCTAGQATDDDIIRRMRCACRITKATNTHSQYVIAFPLLQSSHERALVLRYTYIDCVVRVLHLRMVSSKALVTWTSTLSSHEQQKGQMLIKCFVHAWAVRKAVVCIDKYRVMCRITTLRSTTERIFDGCPIRL